MGWRVALRGAQEPTLPLSGRHRRAARPPSRRGCPQIGSLQRYTTTAGPCSPRRARDAGGYQQKTSSARAYSSAVTAPVHQIASAAMPVRRGARPGREHRHTFDMRTARLCAVRIRALCRGPAPALWVLQASTRSRRARARVRVRVSQGPPLPRPVFRYTTERAGRLGGRASHGLTEGRRSLRQRVRRSCGGAPVAPWHRGEASSWSPLVGGMSNGRTALAAVKTLESSTTWLA